MTACKDCLGWGSSLAKANTICDRCGGSGTKPADYRTADYRPEVGSDPLVVAGTSGMPGFVLAVADVVVGVLSGNAVIV